MPPTPPTVIAVDVTHDEELDADGFDLFVTVRGSSVFTGRAVFEKAAEVRALVDSLGAAGIARADVTLMGLHVDVESGLMSKSSSAVYSLRVRSNQVEQLAAAVTAIAQAKSATVSRLAWRYPDGEETTQAMLRSAIRKARGRAEAMAEGAGLRIDSVSRVTTPGAVIEPSPAGPPPPGLAYGSGAPALGMDRARRVDLGLEVAPTRRVSVAVIVELTAVPANAS
jgi:uncharacterized protein YggE